MEAVAESRLGPVVTKWFEDYSPMLLRRARRLTRNPHNAEDLVSTTFCRAVFYYDQFSEGTNARAWLFRILLNTHINNIRHAERRPSEIPLEDANEKQGNHWLNRQASSQPSVLDQVLRNLEGEMVQDAIDRLPPHQATAIRHTQIQGQSYEEAAEEQGVARSTIGTRIIRGKELLRKDLSAQIE